MIDRTFTTYSILTYLTDKGMSQMDLYVPLACKSISKRDAVEITASELGSWFEEDYGLSIYKGVFVSLVKKLTAENFLHRDNAIYVVNKQTVIDRVDACKDDMIEHSISQLCESIVNFSQTKYKVKYSLDDIQEGLIEFFHKHDGDAIFMPDKMIDALSKQKKGKCGPTKIKYIISQFIIWSQKEDTQSFELTKKLAKGHALASIVSMKDISNYVGKMKGVTIVLDTPLIYNLLGLNDSSCTDLTEELMAVLQKQGVQFIMYRQHYQELRQTFSSTIYLLKTKEYTLEKATRLLKYALSHRMSSRDIVLRLHQIEPLFKKWDIVVKDAPDYPQKYKEIDVKKLQELIEARYKETGREELDENKKLTIATDIDVISYIFRIRNKDVATNLHDCKALFVTSNTFLAYSSKNYGISMVHHQIPVCLTDVFLSTILWFNYPESSGEINEKLLISECYRNINLSDDLLIKFYKHVDSINKVTPLSQEMLLTLNTSQIVQELLENKTYNDSSLYTDAVADEIIRDIEIKRNQRINQLQGTIDRHTKNINRVAFWIASVVFVMCWLALAGLFLTLKYVDYQNWSTWWRYVMNIASIVPVLWGLCCWMGWIKPKANIIQWLASRISGWIAGLLNK